jgi:two-component system, chemotaxis family, protein-glutamate methylesterase/glutaminase
VTLAPIRVMVVDDSVVVRRLVSDVLSADPRIEVVGTAANGKVALAKIPQLNPDLITLDVEMPVMDGLETLVELRRSYPRLPVVMFSTLTERGATATLDALERGADDYVTKPANVGSVTESMAAVRAELVPKIIGLCGRRLLGRAPVPASTRPLATSVPKPEARADVVAIGVSTGGPDALTQVLTALPSDLPVPVVVVQHMPPVFTKQFADRLDAKCEIRVSEAVSGELLEPGHALVAPGDFHLRVHRRGDQVRVGLDQGTPENYCRPAVDVLFRSVAQAYGRNVLGLVLTGMGSDGARGAGVVAQAGGSVYVQDEPTSVVWGMPGSVVAAGLADKVLPLREVAPAILARVHIGRPPVPAHRFGAGVRP